MVLWCIIVCQFTWCHVVLPCSHLTCYVSVPVSQWWVWTWYRINNLPCKHISCNWLTASWELWLVLMSKNGSLVRDKKIAYNETVHQAAVVSSDDLWGIWEIYAWSSHQCGGKKEQWISVLENSKFDVITWCQSFNGLGWSCSLACCWSFTSSMAFEGF